MSAGQAFTFLISLTKDIYFFGVVSRRKTRKFAIRLGEYQVFLMLEGFTLSKQSKSKRFTHQGASSVKQHAERFPYKSRFSDVDRKRKEAEDHTIGGF